jgi:DNA mismatch endonuclease (patch repair protein)
MNVVDALKLCKLKIDHGMIWCSMTMIDDHRCPKPAEQIAPPEDEASRRSRMMAKIGSRHTGPELRVRKMAYALGYRFRLHQSELPGRPDVVFPRLRKALFVNGCFWHQHPGCVRASVPKTRVEFWTNKLAANVARDEKVIVALKEAGWDVDVIWECETRKPGELRSKLQSFLTRSDPS